jgi:hypothetical protein
MLLSSSETQAIRLPSGEITASSGGTTSVCAEATSVNVATAGAMATPGVMPMTNAVAINKQSGLMRTIFASFSDRSRSSLAEDAARHREVKAAAVRLVIL